MYDVACYQYLIEGYIPSVPANMHPPFQNLDLSYNQLVGSIPTSIADCIYLFEFIASNNRLTGTLSAELMSMDLYFLQLNNNLLHGLLPVAVSEMIKLRTLFLYSNFFQGSLEDVFSTEQKQLAVVDVSENNLHGSIPSVLFHLPQLKALSLAKNCFNAEFPNDVCFSSGLEVLDLDGITSGEGCQKGNFGILSQFTGNNKVYFSDFVSGSLPSCLFELVNITQIYITGNGIAGKLPDIPIASKITDLAVSYNRLSGTIPLSIQLRNQLKTLHLSNNRFSGTIEKMNYFTNVVEVGNIRLLSATVQASTEAITTSYVGLENNRLSGRIPASFKYAPDINILAGNLFMCDSVSSLPVHDPMRDQYFCGSNVLNGVLYTLAAFLLLVALLLIAWLIFNYRMEESLTNNASESLPGDNISAISPMETIRDTIFLQYSSEHVRKSISKFVCTKEEYEDGFRLTDISDQSKGSTISEYLRSNNSCVIMKNDAGCNEMHDLFGLYLVLRKFSLLVAAVALGVFMPLFVLLKSLGSEYSTHTYQY